MSSGGNASDEKLSNLRAILGDDIPTARLSQVLEASNGSLEHAIEIYFGQMQQQPSEPPAQVPARKSSPTRTTPVGATSPSKSNKSCQNKAQDSTTNSAVNKKRSQSVLSSPDTSEKRAGAKQARLDAFFRVDSRKVQPSPSSIQSTNVTNESGKQRIESKGPAIASSVDVIVLDSPPRNKRAPQTTSKRGHSKQERQTNVDPASFLTFQRLCETLQEMSDTTKRLVKLKSLETLIREIVDHSFDTTIDAESSEVSIKARALSAALELVVGGITATPLNVSGSAVSKALQTSLGITRSQISKAYRKNGDIGDCAAMYFQKKTHFVLASNRRYLSVLQVSEGLRNISETDGRDAKQHVLLSLLRACQSKMECRFLVRLLIRNMRIGANMKTILAALAMAMVPVPEDSCQKSSGNRNTSTSNTTKMDTKDVVTLVQKTYDICPSISKIVNALLEGGLDQMKRECSIQVMTPIAPMLAHPIHSLDEIKNKMGDGSNEATMEWKYDGMRCQAHYDGTNIELFSRHMLNMTDQFPDVCKLLKKALKQQETCESFVVDAEIVGVEGEGADSRLLPFQDLSTRRKKMDDGNGIRVKVFAFDLMLLNGESLVNKELFDRKEVLHELFIETNDFSLVSSQKLTSYDENEIKTFLSDAIEHGAEGLMVKLLGKRTDATNAKLSEAMNSLYEAGTRSHSWLKVKRDYVAGYSDTIDVVPIGAWWGSGRKAQKSFLSPILLAVYDDEEDVYRSICRCMTFTDAMYESIREFYFNGTAYPSCAEPQEAKLSIEDREMPRAKDNTTGSVNDDNSYDNHSDKDDKEEGFALETKTEECTSEMDRVNCFPNRPSSAFVITNESPPIWFKPMEVFEVAFADLSLSRQHTAAAGLVDEEGRGVALRFPRFKRRRPDKKPEQATTSIEIAQLFAKQSKIKNTSRSFQANRSK